MGIEAGQALLRPEGHGAVQLKVGSSSSSSGGSTTAKVKPAAKGTPSQTADEILKKYQVREDTMTTWKPALVGWLTDPVNMTKTEADLLDELQLRRGLVGLYEFKKSRDDAYGVSGARYKGKGAEDGHQDAFRHIYWNVLLSRRIGGDFAKAFATAHEGVPGNPADREAMDLYNNELGRRIAAENPKASLKEIQDIIGKAIDDGKAMIINRNGDLVFSNQETLGNTGTADDAPAGGGTKPPKWSGST